MADPSYQKYFFDQDDVHTHFFFSTAFTDSKRSGSSTRSIKELSDDTAIKKLTTLPSGQDLHRNTLLKRWIAVPPYAVGSFKY
jgi:hypothetical protein